MTYNQFINSIIPLLKQLVGNHVRVKRQKILKNNNITYEALLLTPEGKNISPTINMHPYYKFFQNGATLREVAYQIYQDYLDHHVKVSFDLSHFQSFSLVRDKIILKLINYEKNKTLLEQVPNRSYLDLAAVCYLAIEDETIGNATVLIHQALLDSWKIGQEELFALAFKNTLQLYHYEIFPIEMVIRDLIMEDLKSSGQDAQNNSGFVDHFLREIQGLYCSTPMYVLTNNRHQNGAALLLYQNILFEFARQHNCDFYVLPSSVHEVILVPCIKPFVPEDLRQIVREINQAEVEEIDQLSDNVYFFSREKRALCL